MYKQWKVPNLRDALDNNHKFKCYHGSIQSNFKNNKVKWIIDEVKCSVVRFEDRDNACERIHYVYETIVHCDSVIAERYRPMLQPKITVFFL